jgi:hypothetical protein
MSKICGMILGIVMGAVTFAAVGIPLVNIGMWSKFAAVLIVVLYVLLGVLAGFTLWYHFKRMSYETRI